MGVFVIRGIGGVLYQGEGIAACLKKVPHFEHTQACKRPSLAPLCLQITMREGRHCKFPKAASHLCDARYMGSNKGRTTSEYVHPVFFCFGSPPNLGNLLCRH